MFLPPGPRFRIMHIGDSITVGTGNSNTVAVAGYRSKFQRSVISYFGATRNLEFVGWNIQGGSGAGKMCGASGQRVDELALNPYVAPQLPTYKPDAVLLHCGTNDCTQLNTGSWSGGSIVLSITNLGTLLDSIRSARASTHVFVAKLIPNTNAGADGYIDQWNSAMATAVGLRSDSSLITIVDHNGDFKADADWATKFMADTTHPNEAGYALMADTWYTSFISVF